MTPADRARLSLLGLSIGDALGHSLMWCAEGIPARREPPTPWTWSDDTEMAVALVETLEAHGEVEQDELARRFADGFHEGRMYGPSMLHEYFPRVRAGEPWRVVARSLFGGEGSLGNGGAMRVAPLGAWFAEDLDELVVQARRSAEVTHAHVEAADGAIAVALAAAAAWAARGGPPPSCAALLEAVLPRVPDGAVKAGIERARDLADEDDLEAVVAALGNGARVMARDTVPFALWSAGRHLADYREAVWSTVSALGDMDTNAAIVGGVVALFVGEAGVPRRWVAAREPLPGGPEQDRRR
jgi:ADP-ribosylglycohydrolase